MSVPETNRYCPVCANRTDAEFCPVDGTQTVTRKVLSADVTAVREGDVIAGRYRVTGVLGRGGFGAVYAAEHTGTQQQMALKMLLPSAEGADESEVRRFYREAQVTARLKHPNTVRVFDVGQTDAGALYIAMELLHGPTLEQALKERARDNQVLDEREALKVAIPVLRSLHEAHGQQLVHRDLKPANIMLADSGDDEPIVKVLDFGIARAHDSSLTGAGTALGTPAYMSPEQCQGIEVDGRSDLYSLGIILYRCVTGAPVFNDRNPLTLMFHHAHSVPPDIHTTARVPVSQPFADMIQKALAKKPEQRFQSAREMRLVLEAILEGPAIGASGSAPRQVVVAPIADLTDVDSETMAHVAPAPESAATVGLAAGVTLGAQPVATQPAAAPVTQPLLVSTLVAATVAAPAVAGPDSSTTTGRAIPSVTVALPVATATGGKTVRGWLAVLAALVIAGGVAIAMRFSAPAAEPPAEPTPAVAPAAPNALVAQPPVPVPIARPLPLPPAPTAVVPPPAPAPAVAAPVAVPEVPAVLPAAAVAPARKSAPRPAKPARPRPQRAEDFIPD